MANGKTGLRINTLFDTGAMKRVMSLSMYNTLKIQQIDKTNIPCIIGASGESLGALGRARCEVNINGNIFYQTFFICEHLKRPIILGRDFAIQNCIGISWTKNNTRKLTYENRIIAETKEIQPTPRSSASLKKSVKVPPRSCAVVDMEINTVEKDKVEIIPDKLWLSNHPNICTYFMTADLSDRNDTSVMPFVIMNFSPSEYLHLPKDQVVTFAEKDCGEGEVYEISSMEELEKEVPRNRRNSTRK